MVHALQHAQTALLVQSSSPRYLRSIHISYTGPSSIANPRRVYFPGVRPGRALMGKTTYRVAFEPGLDENVHAAVIGIAIALDMRREKMRDS